MLRNKPLSKVETDIAVKSYLLECKRRNFFNNLVLIPIKLSIIFIIIFTLVFMVKISLKLLT